MKKVAFFLVIAVAIIAIITATAPESKAQIEFSDDFSQSFMQIGLGLAVHNEEGVGPCISMKWRHLMVDYTHTFANPFSVPGINIGVYGLPFLADRGAGFNPFVSFDGSFRMRIYGVVDENVIGSEDLKLVFAGGPGLGFSAGPVVVSGKVDFGCQYFPVTNPDVEWRVGVRIGLVVFFDQIGTLGGGDVGSNVGDYFGGDVADDVGGNKR